MILGELKIFDSAEFGQVRMIDIDRKPFAVAADVAKVLGYTNTSKAINDHCKGVTKRYIPTAGGEQEVNLIPEGDIYRLIVRSNLPLAEKFERWVFDEVLPTIRKHGLYATDELLDNPDFIIQALTSLKEERERNKVLKLENAKQNQVIHELAPKATYYDMVLQNKTLLPITKIAKDYGMSGQALNNLLHELGVQYKLGDVWLLYQKHADKGYTQSKTHVIDAERSAFNTQWTQKGRLFIYDLLKSKKGILPVIEREGHLYIAK